MLERLSGELQLREFLQVLAKMCRRYSGVLSAVKDGTITAQVTDYAGKVIARGGIKMIDETGAVGSRALGSEMPCLAPDSGQEEVRFIQILLMGGILAGLSHDGKVYVEAYPHGWKPLSMAITDREK